MTTKLLDLEKKKINDSVKVMILKEHPNTIEDDYEPVDLTIRLAISWTITIIIVIGFISYYIGKAHSFSSFKPKYRNTSDFI